MRIELKIFIVLGRMRTIHCKLTTTHINDLSAGNILPLQRLHHAALSTASTVVSPPYLSIRSLTATLPTRPHKQSNTRWFWYIDRRKINFYVCPPCSFFTSIFDRCSFCLPSGLTFQTVRSFLGAFLHIEQVAYL